MILEQEKVMTEISRSAPEIGVPYKGAEENGPNCFYEYDPVLSQAVAGYRKGSSNPYLEKLMRM